MGVPLAPRIDERLRRYIESVDPFESPADVTRAVGDRAWELGLPRPSYQQVRCVMRGAPRPEPRLAGVRTSRGRVVVVLRALDRTVNWLVDYPGVGLGPIYREALRGR